MRKNTTASAAILLLLLALPAAMILVASRAGGEPIIAYEVIPGKVLKQRIPKMTFKESDNEKLYAGKPVCRLIDSPDGLSKGYMRVFFPYEPPTIWRIVLDCDCFDLVSPEFPSNNGRRTFMPYTFDAESCVEDGKFYFYQILVMPLVAPRHFSLDRVTTQNGFPWETRWTQVPEMHCKNLWNKEMDSYRAKAVLTEKNDGAWQLSPLTKEFVRTKEDLLRTDAVYYVDSNPGGDIAKLKLVINQATKIAMPALADSVNFLGKQWDEHMKKYHPNEYQTWKKEIADYRKAVGYTE